MHQEGIKMTDFTELAAKWREENKARYGLYESVHGGQLENAIPKWKALDPNDESTWPEDGKVYLVSARGFHAFATWLDGFNVFSFVGSGALGANNCRNDCVIQYREKCSIDSPPEKENA